MISRHQTTLPRRKYRLKNNPKKFTFWPEIFACLKFIGFYNNKNQNISRNVSGCSAWRVWQTAILCFQFCMIALSVISYFWYDLVNKSLFHLLDGMLPILIMSTGASYQAIMIRKSNYFPKFLIRIVDISRKIDVKLDYKFKKTLYIIITLPIIVIIMKATAFYCHMKDMDRSNHTAYYFSTKPYLYFTGIYIAIGNNKPSNYVIVIIAQIVIVFLSTFGPLLFEFYMWNIMCISINFFQKSRSDLQIILKRSKIVSLKEIEEWVDVYLRVSHLAEETVHILSPVILVFSILIPLITGIVSYEAAQISNMMPFLSWQSRIVPVFMIALYSVRMTAMSLKGQEFIEEVSAI